MTIPLVWANWAEGPARCCWDQDIIDWLCPKEWFAHHNAVVGGVPVVLDSPNEPPGAVVVVPARYNLDQLDAMNNFLAQLDWVVVVLTSDEESLFPWRKLQHPNMRVWIQSPRPDRHPPDSGVRYLPVGCPAPQDFGEMGPPSKTLSWHFRGQVTHLRRDQMLKEMSYIPDGKGEATPGFTQGLPRADYLKELVSAKVAACPSGPASADSFRVWEALEAGCIPIVDDGPVADPFGRSLVDYPRGFWKLFGVPFPVVENWRKGRHAADRLLAEWPMEVNRVQSWWLSYKRNLRLRMLDDVGELGGNYAGPVGSNITVLVPTSPVPALPSTEHIEVTMASVRERLPHSEVILMIDGVRPEQERLRSDYEEYVRRVLWLANHLWGNCYPMYHSKHLHQAEMTRRALDICRSEIILFVEHDTPLEGDIPWEQMCEVLGSDKADVVRLYHEAVMQPEHEHLMSEHVGDYILTRQWSQRPHLATVSYYRRILSTYFSPKARTMIEDKMHGVVQDGNWNEHRIVLYAPNGNIKRSTHLDARQDEPKYHMRF